MSAAKTGRPVTPGDYGAMEQDPTAAAISIFNYAPKTMDALITLYCEAYADDTPPGRHVETAEPKGGVL